MEFEERDILGDPPTPAQLLEIGRLAGGMDRLLHPGKRGEPEYRQHVAGRDLSPEELADVLSRHPDLLLKPILYDGTRALVGFDEERYREAVGG